MITSLILKAPSEVKELPLTLKQAPSISTLLTARFERFSISMMYGLALRHSSGENAVTSFCGSATLTDFNNAETGESIMPAANKLFRNFLLSIKLILCGEL